MRKRNEHTEGSHDIDRGRGAEKPSAIPGKGWRDVLKRTKKRMNEDNLSLVAGGVAFFLLLGIVPALVALISIYGLVADPQQVEQHFSQVSGVLPPAVTEILTQQMKRIAGNSEAAGWGAAIGILVALWSASSATKKLIIGLNIAYDEQEKRGFIKLTAVTLLLTFGAIIAGLVAIAAIVALPTILGFVGIDNALGANLIRWPLLVCIALIGLAVLFRYGPNRTKPKWRWISPGAVAAMVLWVLGSAGFSFYVSNFGKYNETYGSLAAVVIMLLWLYLSAYVVLMGAEINSQIEHQTSEDRSTAPEPRRKQRGARADDLGEAYA